MLEGIFYSDHRGSLLYIQFFCTHPYSISPSIRTTTCFVQPSETIISSLFSSLSLLLECSNTTFLLNKIVFPPCGHGAIRRPPRPSPSLASSFLPSAPPPPPASPSPPAPSPPQPPPCRRRLLHLLAIVFGEGSAGARARLRSSVAVELRHPAARASGGRGLCNLLLVINIISIRYCVAILFSYLDTISFT